MTTIYRASTARLNVADAKRLILDAVPLEKAVDVFAFVDERGNIDFDGPIEKNFRWRDGPVEDRTVSEATRFRPESKKPTNVNSWASY